jgi:hypothetical protein
MNLYAQALEVQDACNLRAIARLLVKAADAAADKGGKANQEKENDDALRETPQPPRKLPS